MKPFPMDMFGAFSQYAGKIRTMRNDIRAERFMRSLPAHLRKDIGWPDLHELRRGRRG